MQGNGLLPLPVCSRSDAIFLLEAPVEVGQVKETAAFCDGQDAVIFREQKSGGNGKTVAIQITGERCVQVLLKEFHKM